MDRRHRPAAHANELARLPRRPSVNTRFALPHPAWAEKALTQARAARHSLRTAFLFAVVVAVWLLVLDVSSHGGRVLARKMTTSVLTSTSSLQEGSSILSGNPIDDCWMSKGVQWRNSRQHIAWCALGYGENTRGGVGGEVYIVNTADDDPVNPRPGSLRHAVIQEEPLWIKFNDDFVFTLTAELYVNSRKTIDGRGKRVEFANGVCLNLKDVHDVIIHGLYFNNCSRAPNPEQKIRVSPTEVIELQKSLGHSILVESSYDVWIDHCAFHQTGDWFAAEGMHIDVKTGSTNITISNSYFRDRNKAILLGHSDDEKGDVDMRVTLMFNVFGENLVQRMPRCRFGSFHIVNNYYPNGWVQYAIGGSSDPTILSERNYFVASQEKEVTERIEDDDEDELDPSWPNWNWKSVGDHFENGAYFAETGDQDPLTPPYTLDGVPAKEVPEITRSAGPLRCDRFKACVPQPGGGIA